MISNNENQDIKINYLNFDELTYFENNLEIDSSINNIKKNLADSNSDWHSKFESIDDLRKLNKFNSKLFVNFFNTIILDFVKLITSIRSNIAKLSLILLKEFYSNSNYFRLKSNFTEIENYQNNENLHISHIILYNIFDVTLPSILSQSCSMKTFLKEEALLCLDNLSVNVKSLVFLKKLINEINNKNIHYSENSFNAAFKFLENIEVDEIIVEKKTAIKDIMEYILHLYSLKKDLFSKKAVKLMNCLKIKIEDDYFENSRDLFDMMGRNSIDSMIKDGTKNKTVGNFKEFIITKKK